MVWVLSAMVITVVVLLCLSGLEAERRITALEKDMRALRDSLAAPAVEESSHPRMLAPVDRSLKTLNRRAH